MYLLPWRGESRSLWSPSKTKSRGEQSAGGGSLIQCVCSQIPIHSQLDIHPTTDLHKILRTVTYASLVMFVIGLAVPVGIRLLHDNNFAVASCISAGPVDTLAAFSTGRCPRTLDSYLVPPGNLARSLS